jgi:RimJ/RimL family protein N-acetyltransferase
METKIFGNKRLTIRELGKEDLKYPKEYMDFVNSLVDEEAKILMDKKIDLKTEKEFLKANVKAVQDKNKIFLIARDENKIVANTSIELQKHRKNHIGRFAIAIRDGYRGIGLGSYLMPELIKRAQKKLSPKPKMIQLEVLANNKPAIGLYKKVGFKQFAKLPKQIQHKGRLVDEFTMIKFL